MPSSASSVRGVRHDDPAAAVSHHRSFSRRDLFRSLPGLPRRLHRGVSSRRPVRSIRHPGASWRPGRAGSGIFRAQNSIDCNATASHRMPRGVLLGFALLNRTGEVLACQQLGISRVEMMIPVLLLGVLISAFQFALSETLVPAATREAKYLYEVELKGRQLEGVFANTHIWVRVRDGFLSADSYDHKKMELAGITLYRLGPAYALTNIFHAEGAHWNGGKWVPQGITRYKLSGGEVSSSEPPGFLINITPADLG